MPLSVSELAELIDRHAAPLRLWAGRSCPNPDDAVQEALCRLVAAEPAPLRPVAWLYRSVRNAALSQARSEGRRRRHEQRAAIAENYEGSPADRLAGDEAVAAIDVLDDTYRQVLIARIWGELSLEDIAEINGISTATAFRQYREALVQLRRKLDVPCLNSND